MSQPNLVYSTDEERRRSPSHRSVFVFRHIFGNIMADTLSKTERSTRRSLIRGKDTKPELTVRRLVHALGFRYRLHRRDLPGTPDLVFPGRKKIILVHGCFWHFHSDPHCTIAHLPKSRLAFWKDKLEKNWERDQDTLTRLQDLGWTTLVIWECQLRDEEQLQHILQRFLHNA